MANDPLALATPPDAPSEDEYQAFVLALSESARGRAFLAEHARRSRSEESAKLLSSVQQLESLVRSQLDTPPESPRDDMHGVLDAIRAVQAELNIGALAAQVAQLAGLIEGVQQRIETLATPAALAPPREPMLPSLDVAAEEATAQGAADLFAAESTPDLLAEAETVIDEAEGEPTIDISFDVAPDAADLSTANIAAEDEAPIAETDSFAASPEPAASAEAAAPDMQDEAAEPAAADDPVAMPDIAWSESEAAAGEVQADAAPAETQGLAITALVETLAAAEPDQPPAAARVIKAGSIPPPAPFAGEDFSGGKRVRTALPSVDPLADVKALSEEERLALFT